MAYKKDIDWMEEHDQPMYNEGDPLLGHEFYFKFCVHSPDPLDTVCRSSFAKPDRGRTTYAYKDGLDSYRLQLVDQIKTEDDKFSGEMPGQFDGDEEE